MVMVNFFLPIPQGYDEEEKLNVRRRQTGLRVTGRLCVQTVRANRCKKQWLILSDEKYTRGTQSGLYVLL